MPAAPAEAAVAAPEGAAAKAEEASSNAAESKSGGGFMAWLPLVITVVAMPVLAYATTTFVLLPKIKKSLDGGATAAPAEKAAAHGAASSGHGEKAAAAGEKGKGGAGAKVAVPVSKILVNLAGSMGTRYLLASLSLVGESADFKEVIEKNQPQLVDLASGILGSKTIADLEQPGARNLVRTELLTVFNNTLGAGTVKEIYITEFAVQ